MSGCLPVWHFAALFLHFIFINHHILLFQFHHFFFQITQSFSFFIVFFLYTPYSTPKCPTFFSIRYITPCLSTELAVNFLLIHFEQSTNPVLLNPLFVSGYFSSFCKNPLLYFSITVVKPFLFTLYFSSTSLALLSSRVPICPFFNLSRMLTSFFNYFISSSIRLFHHGSFFFPPSDFLRPN